MEDYLKINKEKEDCSKTQLFACAIIMALMSGLMIILLVMASDNGKKLKDLENEAANWKLAYELSSTEWNNNDANLEDTSEFTFNVGDTLYADYALPEDRVVIKAFNLPDSADDDSEIWNYIEAFTTKLEDK